MVVPLAPAALLLLLLALAWRAPDWVEWGYAQRIGPALGIPLSRLSGGLPIGLAEWVVLLAPALALGLVYRAFLAPPRATRWSRRLDAVGRWVVQPAAWALLLFYLLWGLHYTRPPLVERLGWSETGDPASEDGSRRAEGASRAAPDDGALLAAVAADLVEATNVAYLASHGVTDLGRPSHWRDAMAVRSVDPPVDRAATLSLRSASPESRGGLDLRLRLDRVIDAGLTAAGVRLDLGEAFTVGRGPAKPVRNAELMSRLQLAGFYFPWTGEANYNAAMPAMQQPHTIAHEKAHQRGIASEDEANFIGFASTLLATEPYVCYSGLLFGQRQLLRELLAQSPTRAEGLIGQRLPGIQRDVDAAIAYWRRYDGRAAELQRDVNDRYLRANRVTGGIDSYRQSVRLILRWAEAEGGRLPLDVEGAVR